MVPGLIVPSAIGQIPSAAVVRALLLDQLGTILGVTIATIGISGLQQLLPGNFFLEPLFNGLTLVAAITIASLATRRRVSRADAPTVAPPTTTQEPSTPEADGGTVAAAAPHKKEAK